MIPIIHTGLTWHAIRRIGVWHGTPLSQPPSPPKEPHVHTVQLGQREELYEVHAPLAALALRQKRLGLPQPARRLLLREPGLAPRFPEARHESLIPPACSSSKLVLSIREDYIPQWDIILALVEPWALWTVTEDDVVNGLRQRGLPLDGVDDLTARERDLIRQYVDLVFNEAARELLDMLAVRIRSDRGTYRAEDEPPCS